MVGDRGLSRDRARRLRRASTDAEIRLWSRLRNRQLGVKFRRQYQIGPYFADFCCIERGLVVEADGGQHAEHTATTMSARGTSGRQGSA